MALAHSVTKFAGQKIGWLIKVFKPASDKNKFAETKLIRMNLRPFAPA